MEEPVRRRFLDRARLQALRMAGMVDDLLVLARAESPGSVVPREPIDWVVVLREVVPGHEAAARAKRIDLEVRLPDRPVVVSGGEEALRRVAGNLLDNAVKYTPPGGSVRVRLATRDGSAVLEVEDTGPGIPERDRERVFERFYRVDKGRSREAGGTGLGLAIVKHLVRALGGTVTLEAPAAGGSLFRVALPLR
jgi:signal transduction histidine kinase